VPFPGRHWLRQGIRHKCSRALLQPTTAVDGAGALPRAAASHPSHLLPCILVACKLRNALPTRKPSPAARSLAARGGAVLALALGIWVQGGETARLGDGGGRVTAGQRGKQQWLLHNAACYFCGSAAQNIHAGQEAQHTFAEARPPSKGEHRPQAGTGSAGLHWQGQALQNAVSDAFLFSSASHPARLQSCRTELTRRAGTRSCGTRLAPRRRT